MGNQKQFFLNGFLIFKWQYAFHVFTETLHCSCIKLNATNEQKKKSKPSPTGAMSLNFPSLITVLFTVRQRVLISLKKRPLQFAHAITRVHTSQFLFIVFLAMRCM